MLRLLKNTTTDITGTFYVNGIPTNATGGVTVNIVNSSGTIIVTGGTGTPTGLDGEYRFELNPTVGTGTLDTLAVGWAGVIAGSVQSITTVVELVGGFVFTIAEARATQWGAVKDNQGNYR